MNHKHTINIRGEIMDLVTPKVMGIINLTPDSFYEGSRRQNENEVLKLVEKMLSDGVDIIDVGGYSSRPGASDISEIEELSRTVNATAQIKKEFPDSVLSIDTFRSNVAREAVSAGADLVNDISAGHLDDQMMSAVAELNVPYIAMHMRGTPQNMKANTDYDDLMKEMMSYFSQVIELSNQLGIKDLIIDPGFGFAKTIEQNYYLLNHLEHFRWLDRPILVGLSRKSMIYKPLNLTADKALNGTIALNTVALVKGAGILRVHDVKEAVETVKLMNQLG
ncbi:MAG: dihydropteroate synthase [Bacteroidota bacterium]